MPRTLSRLSKRYEKSGMTMSTPSISSSGNISPQSTSIMSGPYSNTVEFRPISPTPPNGITDRAAVSSRVSTSKLTPPKPERLTILSSNLPEFKQKVGQPGELGQGERLAPSVRVYTGGSD